MTRTMLAFALTAAAAPALPELLAGAAQARPHHYDRGYDRRVYDSRGYYRDPRPVGPNDRVWRGRDGRYHCRRSNGTTGLIVGGVAGAALGNVIDGGHDRAAGTIIGAVGGALVGRSIDRGNMRCR